MTSNQHPPGSCLLGGDCDHVEQRPSKERAEFERWLFDEQGLESVWEPHRNCHKDFAAHLAFKAWQAARRTVEPCPTHAAEHRVRDTLPCPWCVIDELKRNRDALQTTVEYFNAQLYRLAKVVQKDGETAEIVVTKTIEILADWPSEPPGDSHADTERLDWLETTRLRAVPFSERSNLDEGMEYLWWQIVDGKKSISGHPLGTLREAIDAARQSLTKPAIQVPEDRWIKHSETKSDGCRHCGSVPLATERGRCEDCGKYQTESGADPDETTDEKGRPMTYWGGRSGETSTSLDEDETPCPRRDDGVHCECWYEGEACCSCGAAAMLSGKEHPPCRPGVKCLAETVRGKTLSRCATYPNCPCGGPPESEPEVHQ